MVEADEIRNHMIYVIARLHNNYKLDKLMPLINLLKYFNNNVLANNLVEGKDNGSNNWLSEMDLNTKISYFVNRIHIESAIQVGINKALGTFIKISGILDYVNQLRTELLSSTEMKKLIIVALKQILFKIEIETKGLKEAMVIGGNLECDLMDLIKNNCKVCTDILCTQEINAIDQFCLCNLDIGKRQALEAVSGLLNISIIGFMGHYDYLDIDKIYKGINLPCSLKTTCQGECNCNGPPKPLLLMRSKRLRMVVILADKRRIVCSKWSTKEVDGLNNEYIKLQHVKELEFQVWERRKRFRRKDQQDYMIATTTITLQSLLKYDKSERLTIGCEPAGQITCDVKMIIKDVPVAVNHKIKRRFSIKRKFISYTHGRDRKRDICVSTWEKIFKMKMKSVINANATKNTVSGHNSNVTDGQEHKSTFGNHSDKCVITNIKSTTTNATKLATQERYINMSPSNYSSKLNQINPRTICQFYRANNEPLFPCQKPKFVPKCSLSILEESFQSTKLEEAESIKLLPKESFLSPISNKLLNGGMKTSTPNAKENCSQLSKITMCQHTYLFIKGEKTRSNLELSCIEDIDKIAVNAVHSDDDDAKNELEYDGEGYQERNIVNIHKTVTTTDYIERIPTACSPDLQKLSTFVIEDSGSKSNNQSLQSSVTTPVMMSRVNSRVIRTMNASPLDSKGTETPGKVTDSALETPVDYECTDEWAQARIERYGDEDHHRILSLDDLSLVSVLGQGHFGKVLLARCLLEPRKDGLCAIKVICKSHAAKDAEYESLIAERNILMRITAANNPFLVGLIGCFQTDRHLIFAIEYACGGDLMGHVHKGVFSESAASFYAACIVLALGFLHSNDIMYRDIKLDNLLMDGQGYVKLTDFGLSKEHMAWDSTTRTFCGTPEFLAPEIVREEPYSRVIDWWALGVLIYEMILGETPFPGDEDREIFEAILLSSVDFHDLSADALAIIRRLMQPSTKIRLGAGVHGTRNVMAQKFFRNIDWDALEARTMAAPMVPLLDNPMDTQFFEYDFTSQPVDVDHEDDLNETFIDDEGLFKDFDTAIHWDKFMNFD